MNLPTAAEMLDSMASRYGECVAYCDAGVCKCTVTRAGLGGDPLTIIVDFSTEFSRGKLLRFEFEGRCRGQPGFSSHWLISGEAGAPPVRTVYPYAAKNCRDLESALAEADTPSMGVASIIPMILAASHTREKLELLFGGVALRGEENVQGNLCYEMGDEEVCGGIGGKKLRKLWVEKESKLICRVDAVSLFDVRRAVSVAKSRRDRLVHEGLYSGMSRDAIESVLGKLSGSAESPISEKRQSIIYHSRFDEL